MRRCARVTRKTAAWCEGMKLALAADDGGTITNREGVGLSMALGIDGAGVYVLGVTYRRSRKKDDALVLNVCPWCGSNLMFEKSEEKAHDHQA
jgi:hypothetical protein